jgi:hypothetical protein
VTIPNDTDARPNSLEFIGTLPYPRRPTKPLKYFLSQLRERTMKNPLDSIVGTIVSGFVLTAILYVFVVNFLLKAV